MNASETMSDDRFEALVAEGVDAIPAHFLKKLDNVAITIADEPSPAQRKRIGLRGQDTLYGLYEGIPLTARGENYGFVLPDKITIFKNPILEHAEGDEVKVRMMVRDTVWHEIAHYFGYDDHAIEMREEEGRNYAGALSKRIPPLTFWKRVRRFFNR